MNIVAENYNYIVIHACTYTSAGKENKSTLGKIKEEKWGDNKIEQKTENFSCEFSLAGLDGF